MIPARPLRLTQTEVYLLQQAAYDPNPKHIAKRLGRRPATIEWHFKQARKRNGAHTLIELILRGLSAGLLRNPFPPRRLSRSPTQATLQKAQTHDNPCNPTTLRRPGAQRRAGLRA